MKTVYTLKNCDHQLCCGCARRLISKYCPLCRDDMSSTKLTKRKLEEVEKKFSQLEEDEELARKLQAAEEDSDDDDVVVLRTTRTTTTTVEKRTEEVVRKQRKKGDDSEDDEWKPIATKRIRF